MLEPATLDAAAVRSETPCGDGVMVWRAWGAGPPLVLLHGGSGSWRHWMRNIPVLARTRRVLAPDLPGLGDSASPPSPWSPESIAAIVAGGLADLLGEAGACDLAGFSFGSIIAGHLAALRPALVRSLTLVGAGALGLPRSPTPLQSVREKTGAAREAAHRANLASLMFADPAKIDAQALRIQDWNTRHARVRSRGLAESGSLRDALRHVRARLAAIWGERDAVSWPHIEARVAVLRALHPEVAIRILPGAGHWVAYEAADAFNAAFAELLGAAASRPAR
ncbi:MAG: alpha/beta fold hydrolase [Acidisphaera sp.]|nr:alpha/beta fold hydrolase [Acidisphaera sp.]